MEEDFKSILLEISNVRISSTGKIEVQLRADRDRSQPRWWKTPGDDKTPSDDKQFKLIADALEKKRPILAQMTGTLGEPSKKASDPKYGLKIESIIVQYVETLR